MDCRNFDALKNILDVAQGFDEVLQHPDDFTFLRYTDRNYEVGIGQKGVLNPYICVSTAPPNKESRVRAFYEALNTHKKLIFSTMAESLKNQAKEHQLEAMDEILTCLKVVQGAK